VTADPILPGLWRFQAEHPDWTVDEGGEEGWEPLVGWWAISTSRGLMLIDPLVLDWRGLDALVAEHGGCAGIVRTIHWHQRSVAEGSERYGVEVWAGREPNGSERPHSDHALADGQELWDGIEAFATERWDEIALWLPVQAALVFGDAMLRREGGELRVCPESWEQPEGGPERLRSRLRTLSRFPVEHVLVSHGPLVLGDGLGQLQAATG
jgi:hypothetical protein